ncbi:ABC transporter ATP-binding protein [Vallitalea sp.]|jgi:peptide/nickel transport system ATP-binding protein|uniref:ABC transporter ATP-binding protein n=1 Tax=Vallitalea sp. TaxID=1882829 RepID=UPI0025D69D82|nr:dipeptide ABC transporter ATP-binding protein [Vallitalea sp.]MCT4686408.1 dipeptide ABC transporter ATP-binding protein [Vallitalea sp.]
MTDTILEVNNLVKYFPIKAGLLQKVVGHVKAVDGVSFELKEGKTFGLVGESGCGKTTAGRTILRLTEPTDGEVIYNRENIFKLKQRQMRKLRPELQIIFQDPYSSLSPRLPIGEIVGEGVKEHNIVLKEEYKDYIIKIIEECGLQNYHIDRYPHEFSGGQRQRICIARALALNPKVIIADEPVSALDVSIQAQIINLLKDIQEERGLAYVFISHDLSVVEHIADEVGVMYLGNLVEKSGRDEIFKNPLHPYTKALFSAVPVPDPTLKKKRIILQGEIPSPANPPKGCKFCTRCSYVEKICREETPEYKDIGNNHYVACHLYN